LAFKFIHSADWQLGKPFGGFESDLAGELKAARRNIIPALAKVARDQCARHIVVAGDVWDSELPSPGEIQKPLDLMADASDLTWWLMPGNHDLHRKGGLWSRVQKLAPANVRLLLEPRPFEVESDVFFLPAPWTSKFPANDLTVWMDSAETPAGAIRIGIGHGGYKSFGSDAAEKTKIDEERPGKARLDYFALGDWHGKLQVNDRAWYSGTPEPDRFVNNDRGYVLVVETKSTGALPIVTPVKVSTFDWPVLERDIRTLEDIETLRNAILDGRQGSATLLQLHLSGAVSLDARSRLDRELSALEAQVQFLDVRASGLQSLISPDDLDTLDTQGSVRQAAEQLQAIMEGGSAQSEDAKLALSILFTYALDAAESDA